MRTGVDNPGSWVSLLVGGRLADTWRTQGQLLDTCLTFGPVCRSQTFPHLSALVRNSPLTVQHLRDTQEPDEPDLSAPVHTYQQLSAKTPPPKRNPGTRLVRTCLHLSTKCPEGQKPLFVGGHLAVRCKQLRTSLVSRCIS